jgi:hypothetical protein
MNLKEKAIEAKLYGKTKTELIKLIEDFLIQYKQYEESYKNLFNNWRDNLIENFKTTFISENFEIKGTTKNYSNPVSSYTTISASLYDLEFELLIDNNSGYEIRFIQTKPTTEAKNIILRPTIKEYKISKIQINNSTSNRQKLIDSIYDINKALETVNKAGYSVLEMNELNIAITKEIKTLLEETSRLEAVQVKSIALNSNNYGINDSNKYGEFEHFTEFVDML